MSELPEDLIVEILRRLPMKSLMEFKTLSEEWYNIISNVCAPKISCNAATAPSGFVFLASVPKLHRKSKLFKCYVSYPEGDYCDDRDDKTTGFVNSHVKLLQFVGESPHKLLDCCNSLLLYITRDAQYYVCNPATKQCFAVPNFQRKDESYIAPFVFENCTYPHRKIVRFLNVKKFHSASKLLRLDIFSSATGKWVVHKVPIEPSTLNNVTWAGPFIYLDGKLYEQTKSEYLLCFDLSKLTAHANKLPVAYTKYNCAFIGVCKGLFYYAAHDSSKSNICIWLLECGNHNFWTLRHCISFRHLMSLSPAVWNLCKAGIPSTFMPYAIHPTADIIFLGFPTMLLSYNLECGKLEVLFEMSGGKEISSGHRWFYPFSPCFIVLNDFSKDPPGSSLLKNTHPPGAVGTILESETMSELPEDLITEILCRLPVKSLMEFKRVSKEWYNLLSNVCAPKISCNQATVPSGFVFSASVRKLHRKSKLFKCYVSYPEGDYCDNSDRKTTGFVNSYAKLSPFVKSRHKLLDCCNGLLLYITRDARYYVCNPTTKQCFVVPNVQRKGESYIASLVFENCTSPHYKIVRFLDVKFDSASKPLRLDIFSSATGKWVVHKVATEPSMLNKFAWAERSVYLDGKLYQLTISEYLLCFDLSKLTAHAIKLPVVYTKNECAFIGVCKGLFYYAAHDSSKSNICIWLLENSCGNHNFWTLRHCISFSHLMSLSPAVGNLCKAGIPSTFMPYAIHPNADIIFLGFPTVLLSYNLECGKLEVLFEMSGGKEINSGHRWFYPFSPCFIVLNDFSKDPPGSSLFKNTHPPGAVGTILESVTMSELPEDLITEILCRLPVKSLMEFKRVSKEWYNLISNVCAPKISCNQATVPSGFVFSASVRKLHRKSKLFKCYVSYPEGDYCDNSDRKTTGFVNSYAKLSPFVKSRHKLLDCCNGLLLYITRDARYYVCNPTTKQCFAVPNVQRKGESYIASLVFENCTSPHYKIVRFLNVKFYSASKPLRLDIFSSATGKWAVHKVATEPSMLNKVAWAERSIYLDGKLYQLTISEYLLCFDLSKLTAHAIKLPVAYTKNECAFIGVCKGLFYYAAHDSSKSNICIWLLENSCGKHNFWTLRHCISFSHLMSLSPAVRNLCKAGIPSTFMPYAIHPSADIIFLGFPTMLLSYNLECGKLEVLFKMSGGKEISSGHRWFYPFSLCFIVLNDFSKDPSGSLLFKNTHPTGAVGTILEFGAIFPNCTVDFRPTSSSVLVCSKGGGLLVERMELVAEQWEANIKAEFVPVSHPSLTQQYEYHRVIITDAGLPQTGFVKGSLRPLCSEWKLKWTVIKHQDLEELNLAETIVSMLHTVVLQFCGTAEQALPQLMEAPADISAQVDLDKFSDLIKYLQFWKIEDHVYINASIPPTENYRRDVFFQIYLVKEHNPGLINGGALLAFRGRFDYLLHQMVAYFGFYFQVGVYHNLDSRLVIV